MGSILAIISVVSVIATGLAGLFGGKLVRRTRQLDSATRVLTDVSNGLRVVESSVAQAKQDKSGAGAVVTGYIKAYGPAAIALVNQARNIVHMLSRRADEERLRRMTTPEAPIKDLLKREEEKK